MHPIIAIYFKSQFSVGKITNYEDLKVAFKNEILNRKPNEWVLGIDFLEERFDRPENRFFPSKIELDKISDTHPIALLRHDGHICATNSRGLEIIGLNTRNLGSFVTESGQIKMNKTGEPNGIFTEGATSIVLDQIGMPDLTKMNEAALEFSTELASYGITTVGGVLQTDEEGPAGAMGSMELPLFQTLMDQNCLLQDYCLYLITGKGKILRRAAKKIKKLDAGRGQFRIGGMKRFLDGTIGTSTAYMNAPFSDSSDNDCGMLVINPDDLYTQMKEAYLMGFQLLCHSIGDRSNRILVDIYSRILSETAVTEVPAPDSIRETPFRIEHASILTPDVVQDIARCRIAISTQPVFLENEHDWLSKRLGPEREKLTYPFRTLFKHGILIAGASDAPVESANVLNALGISLHRFGFNLEEGLTIEQALRMFTSNAAQLLGENNYKGSLDPGKFADFVILNRNILTSSPEQIENIRVISTYRRGTLIYSGKMKN